MGIIIKGFIPATMLDWEGKLATVLFTGGCNFRCPWCQNPDLVLRPEKLADIKWEKIEKHLREKAGWLDGVVVSGGEPTINKWLPELLILIKSLGYPVKLDTNGSKPDMVRSLIENGLVDYIAMDIKASLANYNKTSGVFVNTDRIRESINLILSSNIDYEFRTTVVPGFVDEADILEITGYIKGGKRYILQQFSPKRVIKAKLSNVQPYEKHIMQNMVIQAKRFVDCSLRAL